MCSLLASTCVCWGGGGGGSSSVCAVCKLACSCVYSLFLCVASLCVQFVFVCGLFVCAVCLFACSSRVQFVCRSVFVYSLCLPVRVCSLFASSCVHFVYKSMWSCVSISFGLFVYAMLNLCVQFVCMSVCACAVRLRVRILPWTPRLKNNEAV